MVKGKKLTSFLFLLVALTVFVAACGANNTKTNNSSNGGVKTETPAATDSATPAEPKTFRFTIASEPPSLDPALMTDAQSNIVGSGMFEGLMRLNIDGEPENGVAESFSISDDGLTYTFKLRTDAKWTNGDAVTAEDFVYAWKRILNPDLAADYAYMLYYIEGAEAYNGGTGSADDVQVTAVDTNTLEVTLITPTPYFLSLLTHNSYWPVHPATVDAREDWAIEANTMVTNGPYILTDWKHNDKLVLTKNPNYFNASKINFDEVTVLMVEDDSTVFNMFANNEIDWIGAQAGAVPTDQTAAVIKNGEADVKDISSVYYLLFNTTVEPFNNAKIRKAFSMALDRQSIIDNVTQANQTPAYGLVPGSIAGVDGKTFREIYPDTAYFKEDVEEAKKLLAEGLAELNLTAFPATTFIYNTSEGHRKIAEAAIDMWRNNLGVELGLSNLEWGTFLETRSAQQFSIARGGWGADFNHAINFTYDLIHSSSGNNDGKYTNAKVDQLLEESIKSANEADRIAKIAEAERIAFQEDMGLIPLYYYTTVTMIKPNFVNIASDYAGHLDWITGDIQK